MTMTDTEFQNNVERLKVQLHSIVNEYIGTHKQYNIGDILKVSFIKNGKQYVSTCQMMNIYLAPSRLFASMEQWPTSRIIYTLIKQENPQIFSLWDELHQP
jgi:hypothetical protein